MYDDDHVWADGLAPNRLPVHQLMQGRANSYILSITGILVDSRRSIWPYSLQLEIYILRNIRQHRY